MSKKWTKVGGGLMENKRLNMALGSALVLRNNAEVR